MEVILVGAQQLMQLLKGTSVIFMWDVSLLSSLTSQVILG